ncbi:hypothetical protein N658DRAFT_501130 [Parathielavia hyrcaniae]|uniref:Uncharacterized protein n=1 Tax=Parathielavia hyrcaniae TaxID=113614 RepID=A0AAN6PTM5_9PEZI|nr:hypothetical protein N658DRAFT_501130 [Parathielavia hyrcaniae]
MPHTNDLTSDVILAIQNPYMSQIVNGTENYEFRKYCLKPSVKRIWFYRTAPHSALTHICEILPARTRNPGDTPLEDNGSGNAEFNNRHKDWDGYDFAYKIVSVYELREPISLTAMIGEYGFKAAPRGLVYLPQSVAKRVAWREQNIVIGKEKARDVGVWGRGRGRGRGRFGRARYLDTEAGNY